MPPTAGESNQPPQLTSPGVADLVPRPDPTVLTTQLVDRALAAYREVVETRLEAMDRATRLLADELVKITDDTAGSRKHQRDDFDRQLAAGREYLLGRIENVREKIENVRDLTDEKFSAVDTRLLERDTRTEQAAQESRISLAAALAAAKEAVSEQNKANSQAIAERAATTQKQIDALVTLMATSNRSLEDKIGDLKARLDRGEGRSTGLSTGWGLLVGAVLLVCAVVTVLVAVAGR